MILWQVIVTVIETKDQTLFRDNSMLLTHWGRVKHIHVYVSKLTIIGSDNSLSRAWRQSIIRTNAGFVSFRPQGPYINEISIKIQHFHSRKCIWRCRLWNDGYLQSSLGVIVLIEVFLTAILTAEMVWMWTLHISATYEYPIYNTLSVTQRPWL